MEIFILIALICLLLTVSPDLLKRLKLSRLLSQGCAKPISEELQAEFDAAQAEMCRVRDGPSSGEYARTIKMMRAEQKINEVKQKINLARSMAQLKTKSIDVIGSNALRIILSLALVVISILYRTTPVVIFDNSINLQPLTGLLSFPTGVQNGLSVWIWTLSCNVTFRYFYSLIKCSVSRK